MARKRAVKPRENADPQGTTPYEVGYGKPPVDRQWRPGESGNPKGCPTHRANLWPYFCRFLSMTPGQVLRIDRSKLTLAERTALRLAVAAAKGKRCPSDRFAKYSIDRDLGKAAEHLILDDSANLSDEECTELRKLLLGNHADTDR